MDFLYFFEFFSNFCYLRPKQEWHGLLFRKLVLVTCIGIITGTGTGTTADTRTGINSGTGIFSGTVIVLERENLAAAAAALFTWNTRICILISSFHFVQPIIHSEKLYTCDLKQITFLLAICYTKAETLSSIFPLFIGITNASSQYANVYSMVFLAKAFLLLLTGGYGRLYISPKCPRQKKSLFECAVPCHFEKKLFLWVYRWTENAQKDKLGCDTQGVWNQC